MNETDVLFTCNKVYNSVRTIIAIHIHVASISRGITARNYS